MGTCKNSPKGPQDKTEVDKVNSICLNYNFNPNNDPVNGAEYFHDLSISTPKWIQDAIHRGTMKEVSVPICGKFRFYKLINK